MILKIIIQHFKLQEAGKWFFIICLLFFINKNLCIAQDTTVAINKEIQKTDSIKPHSAKKATWMSLCLPGLGQAYNKQYYKIPIIYAGFGTAAYFYSINIKEYRAYREAYAAKVSNDTTYTGKLKQYPLEKLQSYKNYYRRNLELTYISFALIYILNVLDATVYAHLFDYDISEDLSISIQPEFKPNLMEQQFSAGISLKMKF